MKIFNPFSILDYYAPEYFCNRKEETGKLLNAFKSNRNVTLLSIRRLGKTGLIKHLFYHIQNNSKENTRLLYIDILKTQNLSDFIKVFSNQIVADEHKHKNWFKKISALMVGLKANLSIDENDGTPKLQFAYQSPEQSERSLESIFDYLAKQKENYLIAFDEFQQITYYPEKNVEAILRTHIQHQHKDRYIFSGSGKHLLISMFNDYGRPFYQSTDMLLLQRLEIKEYAQFIQEKFTQNKVTIEEGLIESVLNHLDLHTYYVQYFFNRLYEKPYSHITRSETDNLMQEILKEKEYSFINYRSILTKIQFNVLKAIAKEGKVSSPNSSAFMKRHNFTQTSSINKTLKSLMEKEMIYMEDNAYKVYDVFLSKWLENYEI